MKVELTALSEEYLRAEGLRLCAGCEEAFVLAGDLYCAPCGRLHVDLERRRRAQVAEDQERRRASLAQPRVDVGVVKLSWRSRLLVWLDRRDRRAA